ncbi:MAG TPA: hypothetical protein VFQ61_23410, partial [Polyangiaceae bacterium]|nr:hypothetical protein [Polyangiaceae bacterium]
MRASSWSVLGFLVGGTLSGCGVLVGESFEGYSHQRSSSSGGEAGLAGELSSPGGSVDSGGASSGGFMGTEPPSCPTTEYLITDMEELNTADPSYAKVSPLGVGSGIEAYGFYCGHGDSGAPCTPDASGFEPTLLPEEAHCGAQALKAYGRGTEKLGISLDLTMSFEHALNYPGVSVWAKGAGPFVPGLTQGGDWYDLPELDPEVWQEYVLRWSDLKDENRRPWKFDGKLGAADDGAGHKL